MNIDDLELAARELYIKYDLQSDRPSWFEIVQKGRYKEKQVRINLLGYTAWGSTVDVFAMEDTYEKAYEEILPKLDKELASISWTMKERKRKREQNG